VIREAAEKALKDGRTRYAHSLGLVPLREAHPVIIGALMTGRGRDACRNLGLARHPRRAARRLAHGRVISLDVGVARWPGGQRYFLGWAGVGFDAVVAERAGARGGRLAYLRAVLTSLRDYRPAEMAVGLDGADVWAGPAASVVVCNGASFGGGMRIAPGARPDDGVLDVVRLGALGRAELARWLRGHQRSRFLLTAPPLRLPGAVGSPSTAIATV